MRPVSDGDSRVLGAISSLQGRLEAATNGAAQGRRRGLSVAQGQKLKILPVAGTGAYHTNPISGGCLFGKNRVSGECNFYEKPVYGYDTIVNLPPPKGPPDANGFRALPPVKFPKALLSVQGEKLRKDGDLDWQLKVAQAMRSNKVKLTKLYKVCSSTSTSFCSSIANTRVMRATYIACVHFCTYCVCANTCVYVCASKSFITAPDTRS